MTARGRKRTFDETTVVETVMEAFWRKGFDATSYDDLVATTGVNRHSLYQVLGKKEHALALALDCYLEKITALTAPLRADAAGLADIKNHFDRLLAFNREHPHGCMVCNLSAGPEIKRPEIRQRARLMFDLVKSSFGHALACAHRRGEIARKQDIERFADVLLAAVIAISTLVQSPDGLPRAKAVATSTLALLK